MAFQQSVGTYRGVGQVGHPASTSPIIAAAGGPGAFKTASSGVTIGTFVFRDATDPKIVTNVAPAADSKAIGFIQDLGQATIDYGKSANMLIRGGVEVSPKVAGDFWVESKTVATVGQKVFASVTDGSIATDAAGATVTGHVETDWYVSQGAAVGDLVIISSWSKA
ncbi:structural cement protein Gp24 [Symbiopectobacterium sp. RP]|uniref:structural cement protein Gp24 n=1 Tax=Symbiopectobacterium sp. RP TaxID=3248553 RepID=UPI003D27252D